MRDGEQQVDHAEHTGQYRGKCQTGVVRVLPRPHAFDAGVVPVLDEAVEVFEEPPERGAGRKEQQKPQWPAQHQAAAAAFDGKGIDGEDEAGPDGQKGVGLEEPEPGEPLPGHEPGDQTQGQAGPAPPGKAPRML
jgi:hypothetical protein